MSIFVGRWILKPTDLFKQKFILSDAGKKHPAAARTKINRDIKWTSHRSVVDAEALQN